MAEPKEKNTHGGKKRPLGTRERHTDACAARSGRKTARSGSKQNDPGVITGTAAISNRQTKIGEAEIPLGMTPTKTPSALPKKTPKTALKPEMVGVVSGAPLATPFN